MPANDLDNIEAGQEEEPFELARFTCGNTELKASQPPDERSELAAATFTQGLAAFHQQISEWW
tara:strand:+ start:553 stop:741 length:189 start_codon:yes stop_codon:yes gene_type:complete